MHHHMLYWVGIIRTYPEHFRCVSDRKYKSHYNTHNLARIYNFNPNLIRTTDIIYTCFVGTCIWYAVSRFFSSNFSNFCFIHFLRDLICNWMTYDFELKINILILSSLSEWYVIPYKRRLFFNSIRC